MKPLATICFLALNLLVLPRTADARQSVLGDANAIRIAEAHHLLSYLQEQDEWRWDDVPFAILLLTEERDYLVGHPYPSDDFVSEGVDPILEMEVFSRPRTEAWSLQFLATFPAVNGLSTVVVGTAEATGRSSTAWVVTLLHEHFHQIQYAQPDYQDNVAALDLDGGDTSGMWMLNYPFPYAEAAPMLDELARTLLQRDLQPSEVEKRLRALKESLSAADYRYLTFQFWQEGTSRYMEHVVTRMALAGYEPRADFKAMADVQTYTEYADVLDDQLHSELAAIDTASQGRFVMYPLGAAIGLMLERTHPDWMSGYFNPGLSTLRLVDEGL